VGDRPAFALETSQMTRFSTLTLALVASAAMANVTYAQEKNFDQPYIGLKAELGFGGVDTTLPSGLGTFSSGMSPSFGLAGQYVYPLHEYFALGGLLGVTSWRSSENGEGGRNLDFDLALMPIGKYAVLNNLELYVGLPIGLTLDFLNEADGNVLASPNLLFSRLVGAGGTTLNGGGTFGFMISVVAGARYALSESMGLLAELGYEHHAVTHGIDVDIVLPLPGGSSSTTRLGTSNVGVSWDQFVIHLGAYF
jgi:hypothetical protein